MNQSNSRIDNLVAVVEKLIEKLSACQKQMNEIYTFGVYFFFLYFFMFLLTCTGRIVDRRNIVNGSSDVLD